MSSVNRYILTSDGNFYLVPSNSELYHHGVKGMKWGIRRTPQQLGHKIEKLTTKNEQLKRQAAEYDAAGLKYESKSVRNQKRNAKYEARIVKAEKKKAKYDLKLDKELNKRNPDSDKVGKYTVKSKDYENIINKARKKLKYNKDYVKSEDFKNRANKARDQIAKNERLSNMYSKTRDGLESGTVQQGRLFMQYLLGEN